MNKQEQENYKKAGEIAKQTIEYAKSIIKPRMPLLEIAGKIENKIKELGGKPAFPVNLAINEIAAHFTPSYNDETKASGLLKVDIGVHVNGCIADTAFSIDLENKEENKKLIQASEKALEKALSMIKKGTQLKEIGKTIQQEITEQGFSPVINLSGHELDIFTVHSGILIPNFDNGNEKKLEQGAYAIEPFATTGEGKVYDGGKSGIYRFEQRKPVRDKLAREIMNYVEQEYKNLPFAARWLIKKFSTRALFALKILEQEEVLHHYAQLIEKSHKPVSQAEHTILITDKIEITTN